MPNEQQALAEMPVWVLILLAAAGGVSGEMWRADKAGLTGWILIRRLALRSGASVVCGVAVMFLAQAAGASVLVAGALGSLTAAAGAEVAVGLYERWAARKLGVCAAPSATTGRADADGP
ncbi:phage holin family protein [Pseudomonas delhiensis]|uniref:phage holin family protein n=1 Tax=Pseudomonas delhiensis TaxID=366289 RepID=UPI003159B6A9